MFILDLLPQGWQEKKTLVFFPGFNHQRKPKAKANFEKNAVFA